MNRSTSYCARHPGACTPGNFTKNGFLCLGGLRSPHPPAPRQGRGHGTGSQRPVPRARSYRPARVSRWKGSGCSAVPDKPARLTLKSTSVEGRFPNSSSCYSHGVGEPEATRVTVPVLRRHRTTTGYTRPSARPEPEPALSQTSLPHAGSRCASPQPCSHPGAPRLQAGTRGTRGRAPRTSCSPSGSQLPCGRPAPRGGTPRCRGKATALTKTCREDPAGPGPHIFV